MQEPITRTGVPAAATGAPSDAVRDAFRELHGARLHGFALLLAVGDRALGARLAADALQAGVEHLDRLRHPERAAAWLRARVVRSFPRRHAPPPAARRRAGLEPMDADDAVAAGLAALSLRERAGLIGSMIERLDRHDVGTIVGRDEASLDRLLVRARRAYLRAYAAASSSRPPVDGPVAERVHHLAARTMQ